jgi:hypothetical protein
MVNALHITIEDKPQHDGAAVADDMADNVLELLGCIHEAQNDAVKACQALRSSANLDETRRALMACQNQFHKIERSYSTDLASYDKLKELLRVGSRGAEWTAWARGTKLAIEQCLSPLQQVNEAFAPCWQELTERLGTTNISVTAMNVQRKISLSRTRDESQGP